jgi:peroxiredoxin
MTLVPSTMLPLGTVAPEFALPDPEGRIVRRGDFAGRPLLVIFLCNHCPYVQHLADDLARVTREFQEKGVGVVGINANDVERYPDDAPERMAEEAVRRGYSFPYLFDESQQVARAYHAACTPDFFLFDDAHRLVYRGRYDETRPEQDPPQEPHGGDLRAALIAVLARAAPPPDQLPSAGCNIKWRPGNEPSWFGSGA